MKRRLLNVLTVLSLLLFVAATALSVRSYFAPDEAYWTGQCVSADGTSGWTTA